MDTSPLNVQVISAKNAEGKEISAPLFVWIIAILSCMDAESATRVYAKVEEMIVEHNKPKIILAQPKVGVS
jgi:hypothetical protein